MTASFSHKAHTIPDQRMPQTHRDKVGRLRELIPIVDQKDWTLETPEQPVQIIQKSTGTRKFGTEVVSSPDGSIAPYWAPHPALPPLPQSSSKCSTNASQTRCTPRNSSSLKRCCLRMGNHLPTTKQLTVSCANAQIGHSPFPSR